MAPIVAECRLCGQVKPLIRAHIIPRKFYDRIKGGEQALVQVTVTETVRDKRIQSGPFDPAILCADCDRRLGVFDEYAYSVLPAEPDPACFRTVQGRRSIYHFDKLDVERFRLFLAALVWRASITTHEYFKAVEIGPYEERLRRLLQGSDQAASKAISAAILLLRPPEPSGIILRPGCTRADGVNIAFFYLPPWKLLLRLDKRPFRPPFDQLALQAGRPSRAVVQDRWSNDELRILGDLQAKVRATSG